MWRCVDIVLTDVSKERITYIFNLKEKRKNPQVRNQRQEVLTD
jgi:hypothetical protein